MELKNDGDIPDSSLLPKEKIPLKEPKKSNGSFFVPRTKPTLVIKSGVTEKGISVELEKKILEITYPEEIWQQYPPSYKKLLSDNLTFALTFHLPYIFQTDSLSYPMPRPSAEPFFSKAFVSTLPATALMEKKSSSKLIKKFFEIKYSFNQEKNVSSSSPPPRETKKIATLAFSFGKDSLLTYSLCRELGIKVIPIFIKEPLSPLENFHKEREIQKFREEFGQEILVIDNQTGEFRESDQGWCGWELQLTQYALMALPIVYAEKTRYLFFANEQSCNDKFLDKEGFWCNPVYEQSTECLEQIEDLIPSLEIKNLKVSSLLEPIHELAIIKILHHRYPEFAKYQTSCFAEKPEAKNHAWCGNCSKCARMFIFFLAHNINPINLGVPTDMLKLKYKSKYSLFEDGDIKDSGYDQSRLGRDEQLLAFLLAYKNGHKGELMNLFRDLYLNEAEGREKELRAKFFGIHSTNTIPKELKEKVLAIYEEELKNLR